MAKRKTLAQYTAKTKQTIPYHRKPDKMTLEEWQIALRRQFAENNYFEINHIRGHQVFGDYLVNNPATQSNHKVAFRGINSEWNYCSCLDFKTNQLGTCKHLEAVQFMLEQDDNTKPYLNQKYTPAYTSVYLSYRGERRIRIRTGSEQTNEFETLAALYFDSNRELKPESYDTFDDFLRAALKISSDFICYDDALAFAIEQRQDRVRKKRLDRNYPTGDFSGLLKATLLPYQQEGIRFAATKGRCLIADEMGLGKTIQAIGVAELLKKEEGINSVLIICPTSLKYQWESEIRKFTESSVKVVEGNLLKRQEQYQGDEFYKIVSYNCAANDTKRLNEAMPDLIILDEAQRIKNWKTKIAAAVKKLQSSFKIVLTGTPLENRIEELYSILQFIQPYLLGPYFRFVHEYRITDEAGKTIGYKDLNKINLRLAEVMIRRRKQDVLLQLPKRQDKVLLVPMTKEQMEIHEECQLCVNRIVQKWRAYGFLNENDRQRLMIQLNQMRMVCDSTYILDQKTRHDTKIEELMNILREVVESGDEKVVIFSQWERMTRIIAGELEKAGIFYESLNGSVPSEKRKDLFEHFNNDPECRVFLSTDAGSTGLNLQSASMLINMDIPWNPALLEQRIARIHRMGQKQNVSIVNFVSTNTIEHRMLDLLKFKSSMAEGILDQGNDTIFMESGKFNKLMETVEKMAEPAAETGCPIFSDNDREEIQENDTVEITVEEESFEEEPTEVITPGSPKQEDKTVSTTTPDSPEELIGAGVRFLSGLAQTLSSPEATERLVSSMMEKDTNGKSYLKIPVENQETVVKALSVLGKLFGNL